MGRFLMRHKSIDTHKKVTEDEPIDCYFKFLDEFWLALLDRNDRCFLTNGQSPLDCCSSIGQDNLRRLILSYMKLRTISNRSILNELNHYVSKVRSFEDVYEMTRIACPDYVLMNTFSESFGMIEYACAQASGLKRNMMNCHQKYCRTSEIGMHWSLDEWKSEIIDCYKRELGSKKSVSHKQLETEFNSCASAASHKTPSQKKARVANLRRLLDFYMDRGMINREMIDEYYPKDSNLPSTFDGVKQMAHKIYSYPLHYQEKEEWQIFKTAMMTISQLPIQYERCFKSVCTSTAVSEVVNCPNLAECVAEIEKYTTRTRQTGTFRENFNACVSEVVAKRKKSTTFTCTLSVHSSNSICINLEKKLSEYSAKKWIGNDLKYTVLLNSEKDVNNLAYALYASHSRLYPQ